MSNISRVRQSIKNFLKHFPLTRTFLVFSVLYFPITLLFLNRGLLPEVILALYTLLLIVGGILLIFRFLVSLASSANSRNGQVGSLFILYLLNVLFPLLMFKMIAFVILQLLPLTPGILCEITCFIKDVYLLYSVQNSLNHLIVGSSLPMFLFTLWSVQKK